MKLSVRLKLILAICLPMAGLYAALTVFEYQIANKFAIENRLDKMLMVAEQKAQSLDKCLRDAGHIADSVANYMMCYPAQNPNEVKDALDTFIQNEPGIYEISIHYAPHAFKPDIELFKARAYRNASGKIVTESSDSSAIDYTIHDQYLLPKLLNKPTWSEPYPKFGTDLKMCDYSSPMMKDGKFFGVVSVDVSLPTIAASFSSEIIFPYTQSKIADMVFVVISDSGTYIHSPVESRIMCESIFRVARSFNSPELENTGWSMIGGKKGVTRIPNISGDAEWYAFAPVPSAGWSVAVVCPERTIMMPVYEYLAKLLGMTLIILSIIIVLVMIVSVKITRPLVKLSAAAEKVANGNLDVCITGIKSNDEIGQFAGTFNKMVVDLKNNVAEKIREAKARHAIEMELQLASEIQNSLMPRTFPPFPHITSFDLHAVYESAKTVAGDYYDFFFVRDGVLTLVVGDVSDKGVPAALFMAITRTVVRNFSDPTWTPDDVIKNVNQGLVKDNDRNMFVTLFYARYNFYTGELTYTNAGHNPPYIMRADKTLETLRPTGPMLGAFPDAKFTTGQNKLNVGDKIIIFTDGITEARNSEKVMLKEEGFEKLLVELADEPCQSICNKVLATVNEYRCNEKQDDITLMVLRRRQ